MINQEAFTSDKDGMANDCVTLHLKCLITPFRQTDL
jgi:hypothetical protein